MHALSAVVAVFGIACGAALVSWLLFYIILISSPKRRIRMFSNTNATLYDLAIDLALLRCFQRCGRSHKNLSNP